MREELATSLQEFEGAVILVSHDKFLLQSVADDFYLIEDNKLLPFSGSLDDYESYLLKKEESQTSNKLKPSIEKEKPTDVAASFKQANKLRHDILQTEKLIEKLQSQLNKLNTELEQANQSGNITELVTINGKQEQVRLQLNKAEEEWLNLQSQLENL